MGTGKTGFIVFAHGSRVESANEAVRSAAAEMGSRGGFDLVEAAFLELAPPSLSEAVERLASRGATRVIVIPYFLTMGTHLQRDLPKLVQKAAEANRGVEIVATDPLDGHESLSQILLDRARAALDS